MGQISYKKCGFRDKIHVCTFKEEDCNSGCDMFSLDWSVKAIKQRIEKEHAAVKELQETIKKLKDDPEEKPMKKLQRDKALGIMYLSKAYMYLKRTNG